MEPGSGLHLHNVLKYYTGIEYHIHHNIQEVRFTDHVALVMRFIHYMQTCMCVGLKIQI